MLYVYLYSLRRKLQFILEIVQIEELGLILIACVLDIRALKIELTKVSIIDL